MKSTTSPRSTATITAVKLFLLLLVGSLLLAACGAGTTATSTPQASLIKTSIQLNWSYDFGFAGFYAAQKNGRFTAQNLDVQLIPGGFDSSGNFISPIDSVLSGKADFGLASAIDILTQRAAGKPLVAIGTTLQRSPLALVSLPKSSIRRPQDLVGHKVAVADGGNRFAYNALLSSQGIDPSKVNTVSRNNIGIDSLIKGDIDVLVAWVDSEGVQVKESGVTPNIILMSDYGINTYEDVIFTTETMLKSHPDTVQHFVKAVQDGFQDVVNQPDQAADYTMAVAMGLDKTLTKDQQINRIEASIPLINPMGSHPGLMTDDTWQYTYQLLLDQKIITQPIDYKTAYTMAFIGGGSPATAQVTAQATAQ